VSLEPTKVTVEMIGLLEFSQKTKTFSCSRVLKAWTLSFKPYPKDKGRSSQRRVPQNRDSWKSGKMKKLKHDFGFSVSLEFQFLTISIHF